MSFIIETTDDLPVVLLIARAGTIQETFRTALHQRQFQVEVVTPDQAAKVLLSPQHVNSWYKIIWWTGALFVPNPDLDLLLPHLQKLQHKLTVLSSVIGPYQVVEKGHEVWNTAVLQQEHVLNIFTEYLPQARVVAGQNVVFSRQNRGEEHTIVEVLLAAQQLPQVAIPEKMPFNDVVEEQAFLRKVLEIALRPGSFQGVLHANPHQRISVEHIFRRVGEQVIQYPLEFQPLPAVERLWPNFRQNLVVDSTAEEQVRLQQVIAERIQHLLQSTLSRAQGRDASVYQEAPSPRKAQVVPTHRPVIENRQRKYEERTADLHHRKRVLGQGGSRKVPQRGMHVSALGLPATPQTHLLDNKIQRIFAEQRAAHKTQRVTNKAVKTVKIQDKQKRQWAITRLLAIVMTATAVIGMVAIAFMVNQRLVVHALTQAITQYAQQSVVENKTVRSLDRWSSVLAPQVEGYKVLLGEGPLTFSSQLVTLARETTEVLTLSQEIHREREGILQLVFGHGSGDVFEKVFTVSSRVQDQYKRLSLLQSQLQSVGMEKFGEDRAHTFKTANTQLQERRKVLATLQQLEPLLPSMLAQAQRKTYLVVLQNTQELRPTGGFLQSCALITIENGMIINYQIVDVKNVDDAVNGQIAAPTEVTQFLGQQQWLLRDANWSPDFPESALQIERFVEKGLGKSVDGVLALNTQTLQAILADVGPVNVSEYGEMVTDKNLMEKLEFHSDALISLNKREYSSLVLGKVLDQIMVASPDKVQAVVDELYHGLRKGEVFMVIDDSNQNATLKSLGWTGEIATPACPVQLTEGSCVVDTIMQAEANIGINKANHYLKRSIVHAITVKPNQAQHERTITFTNTAANNTWPAGAYKSYVRFFVPKDAELDGIDVNGSPVGVENILTGSAHQKTFYGVRIEVPVQQEVVLRVRYHVPLPQARAFAYAFFNQRQAGIGETPLTITVTPDPQLRVTTVAPQAEISGQTIRFTPDPDRHAFVGVKMN